MYQEYISPLEKRFKRAQIDVSVCFMSNDYAKLDQYLESTTLPYLKLLFEIDGEEIFKTCLYLIDSSKAINYVIEKTPREILQSTLEKESYKIVQDFLQRFGFREVMGLNEQLRQFRIEKLHGFLRIDREGVTKVFKYFLKHGSNFNFMTERLKEDLQSALKMLEDQHQLDLDK